MGSSTFVISGLNFSSSMRLAGKTFLNFSLYRCSNLVAHNPLGTLRISDLIHFTEATSSKTPEATGRSGEVTATFRSLLVFEMLTDNFGASRIKITNIRHHCMHIAGNSSNHPHIFTVRKLQKFGNFLYI